MQISTPPCVSCALIALVIFLSQATTSAGELPGGYYELMATELKELETAEELPGSPAAMLAAAVLYTQQHPANPSYGRKPLLDLALRIGDLVAFNSEQDESEDRQDYEWEIHCWLDAYRLLEAKLAPEQRQRWRRAIKPAFPI